MKNIALSGAVKDGRPDINPKYFRCVEKAGGMPFAVYPHPLEEASNDFGGLMLCGGGDIDPSFFGQQPIDAPMDINKELDRYELELCREFIRQDKPVLGICRGMQVLNVALGGDIFQDLLSQRGLYHTAYGGPDIMHDVSISHKSFLYLLLGGHAFVNSFHHQSVDRLGKGLMPAAAAPDGVIEAVESSCGKFLGVQWHPERMENMQVVFDYFISLVN